MPDYVREARKAAAKYGLDASLFVRQIRAESNFQPNAGSPMGARGIAQIMPATARGWGVNPEDPIASLNAAAKNMAAYVKKYGNWRDALVAYNAGPGRVGKPLYAETRNYISKILGGTNPGPQAGGPKPDAPGATTAKTTRIPGIPGTPGTKPTTDTDSALIDSMLATRTKFDGGFKAGPGLLQAAQERIATGAYTTAGTPGTPGTPGITVRGASKTAAAPSSPAGRPTAGGGWGGSQGLINSLRRIGGNGLTITSAKRNNTNPYSGKNSDHDHGNKNAYANDLSNGSAPTKEMDRAAYRIMRALGFNNYQMGQPINTSQGVKTIKTANGTFRVQVIYRGSGPAFGGNHLNHVHVGAHRV